MYEMDINESGQEGTSRFSTIINRCKIYILRHKSVFVVLTISLIIAAVVLIIVLPIALRKNSFPENTTDQTTQATLTMFNFTDQNENISTLENTDSSQIWTTISVTTTRDLTNSMNTTLDTTQKTLMPTETAVSPETTLNTLTSDDLTTRPNNSSTLGTSQELSASTETAVSPETTSSTLTSRDS
ncbi:hypothetical protein BpHYR1_028295, partial [Brachionus plicatilis]